MGKLTSQQIEEIQTSFKNGESVVSLSKRFDVNKNTIKRALISVEKTEATRVVVHKVYNEKS